MKVLTQAKKATHQTTHFSEYKKPRLLRGFQGAAVIELQKLLKHWGFYSDSPDGIFDVSLENAVKAFQHWVFLDEDGIVGALTWQSLYTGTPVNMPILQQGSCGESVTKLQKLLQTCRVYSATVDGIFGILTQISVQAFQKRCGLVPDGIVGSYTWLALSKVPH
jgi:peptidoglycan hydrolase-like protein with peptidoglycan-binding domain